MGIFSNLNTEGLEEAEDRLGGYRPLETDVYAGTIKMMYAGASEAGAQNVTVIADFNGVEYRETTYITNREGKNFYVSKDDAKKKQPLPGFTIIDDLCQAATDKPLAEQATEEKMVKIWDRDQKKELPKSVPVLVDMLGKPILVAIDKILENKSGPAPDYAPTAETRESNAITKVFHPEMKVTIAEAKRGKTEGEFIHDWTNRNKGVTRDKRTIKDSEGQSGKPGKPNSPPQAGAKPAPSKSLFGGKAG